MIKTVSVRDLLARQFFRSEFNRYDIFVRYLAIEEYYGKNDYGFRLYSKMQNKRLKDYNDSFYAVENFRKLIKSYEIKGYNEESAISVGKQLALWDGSHRMALHLYHNLPNINVDIYPKPKFYEYKIDWFLKNDFSREEIELIMNKANEVLEKNQIKFTGFLWGPALPYADEIFKDIELFGEVSDVEKFSFKSRAVYNHMVKQIYIIDDVDPSKIETKIGYLEPHASEFIYFHFKPSMIYDNWRIKELTNLPLSLAVERVKSVIRTKYRDKIDNYFYDTILHLCDNQFQSDYCDAVCFPDIDVKNFLSQIHGYNYVLTGMRGSETPYLPEDFPEELPIGKDIDILVMPEDYNSLIETSKKFSEQYKDQYEIILIDEKYKTRIRFHKSKRLILQFDISKEVKNFADEFVRDAVKTREEKSGYYRLSPFYEYLYRFQKLKSGPEKIWHLKYLLNHSEDFDEKSAEKYGDFSTEID